MRYQRHLQTAFLLTLFPGLALAQEALGQDVDDVGFKILTGLGVQATDNLLATSSGQSSDVITTGTLGLSLKAAQSRQSLALNAIVSDNRYDVHQDWNYIGTNFSGGWQWSSGTGFKGAVTGSHVVTQNIAAVNASNTQRNLNTTQNSLVALGYELNGGWDLNSGLVYSSSKNENSVIGQQNFQYSGAYVGATYNFRSGNALTLTTQTATGSNAYDYVVHSNELKFTTPVQDTMTLTWQLLYWNQSYAARPEYDFAALGGGAQVNWPVTAKTLLTVSAQRQFYGNPTPNSIYSVSDSLAFLPTWEVAPKLTLRGQIRNGVTSDYGDPGGGPSGRVDYVQDRSIGVYWARTENNLFSLSYSRTSRTSSVVGSDFVINLLAATATYTF